ncbi:hypothetical protein [Microbacterium sp. G2-8]|uniref:hypothetical protein n=1 Tax=Microbacterium sp. G2-8 TaxID=2842454 RepID=UPI001C8A9DE8|nr:hypothetical protein [Microbacterium sp. G2-8]
MSEWVAEPTVDDDTIRAKTGREWDAWAEAIDAGPGRGAGHTAIAAWVVEQGVDAWWAQNVTVGYERIRGLRLPGQMPDGTFTISRGRTVERSVEAIRALLLDDETRGAALGDIETTLRSKPAAKNLRFAARQGGDDIGIVAFAADPVGERAKLTVTHEKIATPEDGERWKTHWAAWLDALR